MSREDLLWIRDLISDDRDIWYDCLKQEKDEGERKDLLSDIERAQNVICQIADLIREIDRRTNSQ